MLFCFIVITIRHNFNIIKENAGLSFDEQSRIVFKAIFPMQQWQIITPVL